MDKKTIEIPFGAKDSELYKFEYTVPEGYEAEIKDGKVIMKKKESEDERIRKAISYAICAAAHQNGALINDVTKDEALAYLEKQKEQKPIPTEDEKDFLEKEVKAFLCNYDKEFDDDAPTYDIAEHFYQLGKNSQKPLEWSEDFEDNIRNLLHNKLTGHSEDGSMSWTTLIDDKTLKDIVSGIWFYVGKEALKYPNKELNVPKWSEEDEKNIEKLYGFLSEVFCYGHVYVSQKEKEELQAWLKSLRPQPHWKPSEEQIAILRAVLNDNNNITSESANITLESLYNDLKKLM